MQPADITQAENEGGTVLRKQIRAPYLKNADKQDPEMPTTLGSEPEPGSWHESEREGALSVGTRHGVGTPWATDLPHRDHVFPKLV